MGGGAGSDAGPSSCVSSCVCHAMRSREEGKWKVPGFVFSPLSLYAPTVFGYAIVLRFGRPLKKKTLESKVEGLVFRDTSYKLRAKP